MTTLNDAQLLEERFASGISEARIAIKKMLRILLILFVINFIFALFFQSSWRLPKEIMLPIVEMLPSLDCPMRKAMNFAGKHRPEIVLKTGYVLSINSMTLLYGSLVSLLLLIWWVVRLSKIHALCKNEGIPISYRRRLVSAAILFFVCAALPLRQVVFIGDCDVVLNSAPDERKPGVLTFAVVFWLSIMFVAASLYIIVAPNKK